MRGTTVSQPRPAPTGHSGYKSPRRSRRRSVWLWLLAPVVLAVGVIAVGALTREEQLQATPQPLTSGTTAQTPPADADGWQACQDLHELSAAELGHDINRAIARQAQASTDDTIATLGKELEQATTQAASQDPIEGNLAISAAQVSLRQACERVFG
ncbi:hypothetical protein O7623_05615 [Solwaraspora sp. WMMD791]|uniref:hypothetical protein n=1 Tax=Solwaraspora sp. WMMD791 TaxID=3016086 RepID=UPI00249CBE1A|nr:hypothetical protein [Solwaraspora sp. WMMD791]WFE28678.1 hypothetical protein O7623_05615 [Solwaraspora sp. WMMD791]